VGECGIFPPEKYIFRCGIITCAVLLCISCVGVYWSNDGYRCVITLIAALLGCVGLAGLGSVTPIEFALLHEGFTFLYLISFVVYFILFTYHSKVKMVSHLLFITRCILAIISSVCLIIYIVLCELNIQLHCTCKCFFRYKLSSAIYTCHSSVTMVFLNMKC
jgi:hypothetical protein